jgi:prepilin-type N-terminal cleavage/methylation domain-containing protein
MRFGTKCGFFPFPFFRCRFFAADGALGVETTKPEMKSSSFNGFTLIELLAVIAIIAILAAPAGKNPTIAIL